MALGCKLLGFGFLLLGFASGQQCKYPNGFTNAKNTAHHRNGNYIGSCDFSGSRNGGKMTMRITAGIQKIQHSNYGANSFMVQNTGNKDIDTICIDFTTAVFGDAVADPEGKAGDSVAKDLSKDSTQGQCQIQSFRFLGKGPNPPEGGVGGYRALCLKFSTFKPGSRCGFSFDMDPNSLSGLTQQEARKAIQGWDTGGISGAEITGSSVKVKFVGGKCAQAYCGSDKSQAGCIANAVHGNSKQNAKVSVKNGDCKITSTGRVGYYTKPPAIEVTGNSKQKVRIFCMKGFQPINSGNLERKVQRRLNIQHPEFPVNNLWQIKTVDVQGGTCFNGCDVGNVPGYGAPYLAVGAAVVDNAGYPLGEVDYVYLHPKPPIQNAKVPCSSNSNNGGGSDSSNGGGSGGSGSFTRRCKNGQFKNTSKAKLGTGTSSPVTVKSLVLPSKTGNYGCRFNFDLSLSNGQHKICMKNRDGAVLRLNGKQILKVDGVIQKPKWNCAQLQTSGGSFVIDYINQGSKGKLAVKVDNKFVKDYGSSGSSGSGGNSGSSPSPTGNNKAPAAYPTASPVKQYAKNPCHSNKAGQAASCKNVQIPSGICSTCKFRDSGFWGADSFKTNALCGGNENWCKKGTYKCADVRGRVLKNTPVGKSLVGSFKNCRNVYDLDEPCFKKLKAYANANKCDAKRNQIVKVLESNQQGAARQRALEEADYFLYSICEQTCDCIPLGAQRNKRQLSVYRGNCFAHYYYDICQIWDKAETVKLQGRGTPRGVQNICAKLKTFLNKNPNWLTRDVQFKTSDEKDIEAALSMFLNATGGADKALWDRCFDLECSQGRI
eukprot:CAMPEP_0184483784 /NCGR_PEP_ID=MMETSP0113_2-20130426/5450_1 /TAXON_ID=91329 /ORGANISM="Norrisiella sphaerica, Strain BC52" /LENGTH=826 /DNA_ID=CAMNT_0026864389 /DNA_START=43 /DNA_END=2523 /DNA_ORIENTATION=+